MADEIGVAFQKVASVANVAGIDYKKLGSYIATVSSTTRVSAETVGNSMKSLIMRYQQIKEKGFNEEDATNINQVTKALAEVSRQTGFNISAIDKDTMMLRNYTDVLDDVAKVWDKLNPKQQEYLQTILAGSYQGDKFAALMGNYSQSLKLYEGTLTSTGNAQRKFNIYQESTAAKFDKLKASLEGFAMNSINSDWIKGLVEGLTSFVEWLDRSNALIPILAGVLTAILFPAVVSVSTSIKVLIADFTMLNLVSGGLPILIGAIVTGIALLGTSVYASTKALSEQEQQLQKISDKTNELKRNIDQTKESIDQKTNSSLGEIAITEKLTKQLDELAKKENKSTEEKQQMSSIVDQLNQKIPNLGLSINSVTGELNKQVGAIYDNITAYKEYLLVQANSQKANSAASNLIELNTQKQQLEDKMKAYKDFEKQYNQYEINQLMKQAGIQTESVGFPTINKDDLHLYNQLAEELNKVNNLINNANNTIEDSFDASKKYTEKFGSTYNFKGTTSGEGYVPPASEKTGTPPSESDISPALLEKDRYAQLNQELEKTNQLLETNKAFQELDDKTKTVELLEKEQELLKQKQEALHAINEERRNERNNDVVGKLKSSGVTFEGEGTDNVKALNMELVLQQKIDNLNSHRSDKDKTYYNSLKEEYDDLQKAASRFYELEKEIPKTGTEWLKLSSDISKAKDAINDFNQKQLEAEAKLIKETQEMLKKSADDKLKTYSDAEDKIIDLLKKSNEDKQKLDEKKTKDKIDNLEKAHKKEADTLDKRKETYDRFIDDEISKLDKLKDAQDYTDDVNDDSKKIIEKQTEINKYNLAAKSGDMEAISKVAELTKDKTELEDNLHKKQKDREYNLTKETLSDSKEQYDRYIDDLKDKKEKDFNNTKEYLEKQLEASKEANDELTKDTNLRLEAEKILVNGTQTDIIDLFTKTGENATKTGQIIQNELLSKLSQIKEIYAELENLNNVSKNNGVSDKDMILTYGEGNATGNKKSESVSSVEARQKKRYDNAKTQAEKDTILRETENATGRPANFSSSNVKTSPKSIMDSGMIVSSKQTFKLSDYIPDVSSFLNSFVPSTPSFKMAGNNGTSISFGSLLNVGSIANIDETKLVNITKNAANEAVKIIKKEINKGGTK